MNLNPILVTLAQEIEKISKDEIATMLAKLADEQVKVAELVDALETTREALLTLETGESPDVTGAEAQLRILKNALSVVRKVYCDKPLASVKSICR